MEPGFKVLHRNIGTFSRPLIILVSNYPSDNEIINWAGVHEGEKTRSDIGIWRIKLKRHAEVA